jgi:hypothetical protein
VGLEPTIAVLERAKTVRASDRSTTAIGFRHKLKNSFEPTTMYVIFNEHKSWLYFFNDHFISLAYSQGMIEGSEFDFRQEQRLLLSLRASGPTWLCGQSILLFSESRKFLLELEANPSLRLVPSVTVRVTLRLTVCQSVRLGVEPTLVLATRRAECKNV